MFFIKIYSASDTHVTFKYCAHHKVNIRSVVGHSSTYIVIDGTNKFQNLIII